MDRDRALESGEPVSSQRPQGDSIGKFLGDEMGTRVGEQDLTPIATSGDTIRLVHVDTHVVVRPE